MGWEEDGTTKILFTDNRANSLLWRF